MVIIHKVQAPNQKKKITVFIHAPVHIELAPCRRKAMKVSGRRRGAGRSEGEVGPAYDDPGHDDGVVYMQVTEVAYVRKRCNASELG